jgi:hypothetical protein
LQRVAREKYNQSDPAHARGRGNMAHAASTASNA